MIELAIVLTLLQVFDGWATYQIIKNHGKEQNPVVKILIERLGLYKALLISKGFAVALGWLLVFLNAPVWTLGLLVAFYSFVAFNNWNVLEKLRGA
jgi:hypothetical protein